MNYLHMQQFVFKQWFLIKIQTHCFLHKGYDHPTCKMQEISKSVPM